MLETIKNLMGFGANVDFAELVKNGAQIIDVRTPSEFQSGHIRGSVNIPLQSLSREISRIKKDKPVITCCASGMRSSSAKSLLQSEGYTEVYNGGGWMSLQGKIK